MGFWTLAPRLLGRLVNKQKWRKEFQNVILCVTYIALQYLYARVFSAGLPFSRRSLSLNSGDSIR